MTGYDGLALQEALYTKLTSDSTLMNLIGGVYDKVPEGAAFPYVTLGDVASEHWANLQTSGTLHRLALHVYSRGGGRKEVHQITDRLYALLHEGSLNLSGQSLLAMRFEGAEVTQEPDGISYHGKIRFRVQVSG